MDYVIIPKTDLEKILSNQELLLAKIDQLFKQKQNPADKFEYMSEAEAQKILNKKATWFWKQRTSGNLAYSKVGNTIYYKRLDIQKIFEDNFQNKF